MTTVPDVLRHDIATLRSWLGTRAADWLWDRVHGVGSTTVEGRGEARSISRDETFPVDLREDAELERELLALVTRAASDLRHSGMTARTVTVKLRDADFRTRSAQRTLDEPVVTDRVIMAVATALLAKLRSARRVPARLIGVSLSSLASDPKADQLPLFIESDPHRETARDLALARVVDRVREKYGRKGIVPGSLVGD
jgi:DNA polymerase-4